ncbi:hypothetical protein [Neobacillus mesonae]|uniref:hypothetical protein n=1 Tax=Neobacillus mesonae TaxID=1193713 RepID=UPI00203ACBFB|nr:hypothetical protein [Neobacillus mesonae]MCM3567254.1 hypothetical protein [Neobacillus mesonae]
MDMEKEEHDGGSEPVIPFEMGEKVKIKKVESELKQKMEPEDYYYLKGFENKVGTISEQKRNQLGICSYRVDFDEKHFGYFYGKDLIEI